MCGKSLLNDQAEELWELPHLLLRVYLRACQGNMDTAKAVLTPPKIRGFEEIAILPFSIATSFGGQT